LTDVSESTAEIVAWLLLIGFLINLPESYRQVVEDYSKNAKSIGFYFRTAGNAVFVIFLLLIIILFIGKYQ
jgi:succinate dehydrogenase hydrophobic anchor subunit